MPRAPLRDFLRTSSIVLPLLLASRRAGAQDGVAATTPGRTRQAADSVVAIVGVHVLPMDRERALDDQTVIVRGDRIVAIGLARGTPVPKGARRIDGTGRWLMPGLVDMHAHLAPGDGTIGSSAGRQAALYLANGVTTIRSLGTQQGPAPLALREAANGGMLLAPHVVLFSPSINGQNTHSAAEVLQKVEAARTARYDGIKTHGMLGREAYDTLVAAAARAGLPLSGHVTPDVGLTRVIEAGQQVEHLDGWISALLPPDEAAKADAQGQVVADAALLARVDTARIAVLARTMRERRIWNGPTLALFESIVSDDTPEQLAARPESRYLPRQTLEAWSGQRRQIMSGAPPRADREAFVQLRRRIVRALHDAGAPLLAGSDSPQLFLAPGFALHDELDAFVRAGLSPWSALEAATRSPAEYLGRATDWGTVAVGRRADLLLLDADPRRDLATTRHPAAVILAGRVLDRQALDALLSSVEQSAAAVK